MQAPSKHMETWVKQLDKLVIPEGAGFTEDEKPFIEGKLRQLLPADRPGYFRGQPQAICQRLLALLTSTGQGAPAPVGNKARRLGI